MRQFTRKPPGAFNFDNVRKHFDPDELARLGQSLKRRQWHPVVARPDLTVIDGERRVRAAELAGLETLDVIITDEAMTQTELRLAQAATAMHRADLTAWEKYELCYELLQLNPTWQCNELAQHLAIEPSMVTRIMAACKTVPEVREALKAGKLTTSDVYAISKVEEAEQRSLLHAKLSGEIATRDGLERAARDRKKPTAKTDAGASNHRRMKATFVSPSGNTITVSGERLDVSRVIEALVELLRHAREAKRKDWTLAALEQVYRRGKPGSEGEVAA